MSNSDIQSFNVTVRLNRFVPGSKLTIIDSVYNKIVSDTTGSLTRKLSKGLYQVRIDAPGYYQEEYIKVLKDEEFVIELRSYSSIPVYPFKSTHEYYLKPAERYSKENTYQKDASRKPNFFFFLANYESKLPGSAVPVIEEFYFFNDSKTVAIDLTLSDSYSNLEDGLIIFTGQFDQGLYFLAHRPKERVTQDGQIEKGETRILPIYIFENYQTQFFLRYTNKPDFSTSRIYFSERMCFDHSDKVYYALERLLLAFSNYDYYDYLSDEDHINIKQSPYLKALVNILHSALYLSQSKEFSLKEKTSEKELKKLLEFEKQRYHESEVLQLPDVAYLKRSMNLTIDDEHDLADKPPVLSFLMFKYSSNDNISITPASVMDRVAEFLKYDIFWTSFTNIEDPKDIAEAIRKGLEVPSTFDWIKSFVHNTGILGSKRNVFRREDRQWMKEKVKEAFTKEDTELLRSKVNQFVSSSGDAKLIASKFNIPVTTVLRRYKELKKAYNEMESAEAKLMKQDFFKKKS